MAKEIKETPILIGKDAKRFIADMNNQTPISLQVIKRMRQNASRLKAIHKF